MRTSFAIMLFSVLLPAVAHAQDASVKTIELPHYLPYLPAGPDRELFASRCLSCHETRYITMQPMMPEAKWEENVKKMIKTYGAPIREDEAPRLAAYLVAMQHSGPDELAGTVERVADLPSLAGGDIERGKQLFATACASCHGETGNGDGKNMSTLLPHATDLVDGRFTPPAIEAAIVRGVRGTAMPAFPSLSAANIADVVAFTASLGSSAAPPAPTEAAKMLFATNCASCHGNTGDGDGLNARVLARKPTNFYERQPSAQRALVAISEGVPGTAMPTWKAKLDDAQRAALADYVRSVYKPTPKH
jgi:mono/diheme cytochrome c family protein